MKQLGVDFSFARSADDAPLYSIEPVGTLGRQRDRRTGWRFADEVCWSIQNCRTKAAPMRPSARPGISRCSCRRVSRTASAIISASCRAPIRRWSIPSRARFGFLPADQIRLQVAEGRRAQLPVGDAVSVGRLLTEFVELQQIATRKQIQIMSEQRAVPSPSRSCSPISVMTTPPRSVIVRTSWPNANRCSTCWKNIRRANCRSTPIWKCCRCWRRVIIRSRRRHQAIRPAAASPLPSCRRPPVRDAASTRASAPTISPAAVSATPFMRPCARPRPASACLMIQPCP